MISQTEFLDILGDVMAKQTVAPQTIARLSPALAKSWDCFLGQALEAGAIVKEGGELYLVRQGHTPQADWMPSATPSLYRWIGYTADGVEIWTQPQGNEGYGEGAVVHHQDVSWTSDQDDNVWEPGVTGWTEVVDILQL